MAIRFKDLIGRNIAATDGELGPVKDILFDDRTWKVRYFVVNTSKWLLGRKVLLSPRSFAPFGTKDDGLFYVDLTKEEVKDSPPLEFHQPVSRHYESLLHTHFAWEPYWGTTMPIGIPPYPPNTFHNSGLPATAEQEKWVLLQKERDSIFEGHLHSLTDISSFSIGTSDDIEFGKVDDAIIHQGEWLVIDLVVKTRAWMPGGKEFVVSPMFINAIDENESILHVARTRSELIDGPDFRFEEYGERYRTMLVEHYTEKKRKETSRSKETHTGNFHVSG